MSRLLVVCLVIPMVFFSAEIRSAGDNSIEGDCYQCHSACFSSSGHGHPGTENNGCDCCHHWTIEENNLHNVSKPTNSDCINCHTDSEDYRINAAHQVFACVTCHTPHGSDQEYLLRENSNMLCTEKCHTLHQLGRSHPRGRGIPDCNTGTEITCTSTCHKIHGNCPEKLLSSSAVDLCARCHLDKF